MDINGWQLLGLCLLALLSGYSGGYQMGFYKGMERAKEIYRGRDE